MREYRRVIQLLLVSGAILVVLGISLNRPESTSKGKQQSASTQANADTSTMVGIDVSCHSGKVD